MFNILLEVQSLAVNYCTDHDCSIRVPRSFAICLVAKMNIWEELTDI